MARRGNKYTVSSYVEETTNDTIDVLVRRWGVSRGRVVELLLGEAAALHPASFEEFRELMEERRMLGGEGTARRPAKETASELDRQWREREGRQDG